MNVVDFEIPGFRILEHRAGIEPANTGFADQRVSHFATGAHVLTRLITGQEAILNQLAAVKFRQALSSRPQPGPENSWDQ